MQNGRPQQTAASLLCVGLKIQRVYRKVCSYGVAMLGYAFCNHRGRGCLHLSFRVYTSLTQVELAFFTPVVGTAARDVEGRQGTYSTSVRATQSPGALRHPTHELTVVGALCVFFCFSGCKRTASREQITVITQHAWKRSRKLPRKAFLSCSRAALYYLSCLTQTETFAVVSSHRMREKKPKRKAHTLLSGC